MIVITGIVRKIQLIINLLIGIEAFYTEFFVEHLEPLESLMQAMHRRNLRAYEVMAESPADVVIGYENTSTTYISPTIYRKYVTGFQGELIFDACKPDGTPRKLLDVRRLQSLGWRSQISLREGLTQTYHWLTENQLNYRS